MCRSRRELSNEYLLTKFGFDTAENEPDSFLKKFFTTQGFTFSLLEAASPSSLARPLWTGYSPDSGPDRPWKPWPIVVSARPDVDFRATTSNESE